MSSTQHIFCIIIALLFNSLIVIIFVDCYYLVLIPNYVGNMIMKISVLFTNTQLCWEHDYEDIISSFMAKHASGSFMFMSLMVVLLNYRATNQLVTFFLLY